MKMIERLAELLEELENLPFSTYMEEAEYLVRNGVIISETESGTE